MPESANVTNATRSEDVLFNERNLNAIPLAVESFWLTVIGWLVNQIAVSAVGGKDGTTARGVSPRAPTLR